MQIAVLSGKGGTGKTFISVNLACVTENAVYGIISAREKAEKSQNPCTLVLMGA